MKKRDEWKEVLSPFVYRLTVGRILNPATTANLTKSKNWQSVVLIDVILILISYSISVLLGLQQRGELCFDQCLTHCSNPYNGSSRILPTSPSALILLLVLHSCSAFCRVPTNKQDNSTQTINCFRLVLLRLSVLQLPIKTFHISITFGTFPVFCFIHIYHFCTPSFEIRINVFKTCEQVLASSTLTNINLLFARLLAQQSFFLKSNTTHGSYCQRQLNNPVSKWSFVFNAGFFKNLEVIMSPHKIIWNNVQFTAEMRRKYSVATINLRYN